MSDVVIQVDHLWKKYRLGVLGTGTLRHDFNRWLHRTLGKPDPYAIVGENQKAESRKQTQTQPLSPQKAALNFSFLLSQFLLYLRTKCGPCATFPSRSNRAKSSALSGGTGRGKAPCSRFSRG